MTNSIFDKATSQAYSGKTMWIFPSAVILIVLFGYFLDLEKSTQGLLALCAFVTSHFYKTHLTLANAVALLSNSITSNREFILNEVERKHERMAREKVAFQTRLEKLEKLDDQLSHFLFMAQLKEDVKKNQALK